MIFKEFNKYKTATELNRGYTDTKKPCQDYMIPGFLYE